MTLATETLTIRLPARALERLRRVAEISHRPIDEVVAQTIQSTLPPLLEDIPSTFRADLARLESWSNEALRQQIYAKLDEKMLTRYDQLLAKTQIDSLSPAEQQELTELRTQADLLMFRKAYAAILLKWRGERVPTLAQLEAAA